MPNYKTAPNKIGKVWMAYIEHGVTPEPFAHSLLKNDLIGAFCHAKVRDRKLIWRHVRWLWNHMPGELWGSPAKVIRHLAKKQKRRESDFT